LFAPPLLTCHVYILEELRIVDVGVGGGDVEDDRDALDGCTREKAVESQPKIEIGGTQCRLLRSLEKTALRV
jgi:hypothetical protein